MLSAFPAAPKKPSTESKCLSSADWQSTFTKLTGFDIKIHGTEKDTNRPVSKGPKPSFIESILGKRKSKIANTNSNMEDSKKEADDENIVTKVETKEVDQGIITFDDDKKAKKKSKDGDMPQSMLEKYGSEIKMTKKEQRRLH